MIAMQQTSAGSLLQIPVLFPIVGSSAARFGRRTPAPHDRPAALPSYSHGDNLRGAVVVRSLLSPFVADRLRNGIHLSSSVAVFGRYDARLSELDKDLSRKTYACYVNGVPREWLRDPEHWWLKTKGGEPSDKFYIFHEFCITYAAMCRCVRELLCHGSLEACGRKKSADNPFSAMDISLFGHSGRLRFSESRLSIDKLSFFDIRTASRTGLPFSCAMSAFGTPDLVKRYVTLHHVVTGGDKEQKHRNNLRLITQELQQEVFSLLKEGLLRAVTFCDQSPIEPGVWHQPTIDMEASTVRDIEGSWVEFRILSPLAIRKQTDVLKWRPDTTPPIPTPQKPAAAQTNKPALQASDNQLVELAVREDKRRAENGEELLDMKERLTFLRKYKPKLTANYLKTELMPQIKCRAKEQDVPLRGRGNTKQGVSK